MYEANEAKAPEESNCSLIHFPIPLRALYDVWVGSYFSLIILVKSCALGSQDELSETSEAGASLPEKASDMMGWLSANNFLMSSFSLPESMETAFSGGACRTVHGNAAGKLLLVLCAVQETLWPIK